MKSMPAVHKTGQLSATFCTVATQTPKTHSGAYRDEWTKGNAHPRSCGYDSDASNNRVGSCSCRCSGSTDTCSLDSLNNWIFHGFLLCYPFRRRPRGAAGGGCRADWSRVAISWACWISSAVERQKMRPPGTLRIVTGTPSSAATRRMRFFIVVRLVPSGSDMRVAVLSRDWIFHIPSDLVVDSWASSVRYCQMLWTDRPDQAASSPLSSSFLRC